MNAAMPIAAAPAAVPYTPDQAAYEAFNIGERTTYLLDPLEAKSLPNALAETTSRWAWDRGDRLGIREISDKGDRLHIYAVRRKSAGDRSWRNHMPVTEYRRWLDHICTIDLDVIAGIARGTVGNEVMLHDLRQRARPEGARR